MGRKNIAIPILIFIGYYCQHGRKYQYLSDIIVCMGRKKLKRKMDHQVSSQKHLNFSFDYVYMQATELCSQFSENAT